MKIAPFLLGLLLPVLLLAQPIPQQTHIYGSDLYQQSCYSAIHTTDNGLLLAGYRRPTASQPYRAWVVKTDSVGDSLWSRSYRGTRDITVCWAGQQTFDGGYILAGRNGASGTNFHDFWLIKTDAQGDSQWCREYGATNYGERCYAVRQLPDSGYVLAGSCGGTDDFSGQCYWLVRTDANGLMLWSRQYQSHNGYAVCRGLELTEDGGFLLAGNSLGENLGMMGVLKVSATGDSLWSREYSEAPGFCYAIERDLFGDYVLAGQVGGPQTEGSGPLVLKIHPDGEPVWVYSQAYATAGAHSVAIAPDGTYEVFGNSSYGWTVWHLDYDGRLMGSRLYGDGQGFAIVPVSYDRYALAGFTDARRYRLILAREDSVRGASRLLTDSIAFGAVLVGDTAHGMIQIFNAGTEPDSITDCHVEGDVAFEVAGSERTIPGGTTLNLDIRFVPYLAGDYVSVLRFYASPPREAFTATMTGTGLANSVTTVHPQPLAFRLGAASPNPFNPTTRISFALPRAGLATLKVYNLLGREVAELVNENLAAGEHAVTFDAHALPSGLYLCRLESGEFSTTRKMMLLK